MKYSIRTRKMGGLSIESTHFLLLLLCHIVIYFPHVRTVFVNPLTHGIGLVCLSKVLRLITLRDCSMRFLNSGFLHESTVPGP